MNKKDSEVTMAKTSEPCTPDFRMLFEQSPELFLVLKPDTNFEIIAVTDAYTSATKTKREEIIGRKIFEVFPDNPDDTSADGTKNLRASLERVLKHSTVDVMAVQKYDIRRPAAEGGGFEERYWSPLNKPIINSKGEVTAIIHQVRDVTETVRLQNIEKTTNHIEIERANFRNLFKQTPEMVCITYGPDHVFEFVNEAHVKALGFDATGLSVRQAQPDSVEAHALLDRVYETGQTAELHEIPITVGGRIRYFNLTYAARRDRSGQINGIMILGIEVSDQVWARESLQQAIHSRDDFLSIASHELKTPITSLKLQLQIALRGINPAANLMPNPETLSKVLTTSNYQIDRLVRLIDDLLDVSKIRAGKVSFHFERVNLLELVKGVTEQLAEEAKQAGCLIRLNISDAEIHGFWDRDRIEQIIFNLMSNSIKYARGQPINIEVKHDAKKATLTVQDCGVGIPKDKHEKIFERFERATNNPGISGLGLGLFIVKQIVLGHQGSIQVESEVGRGARFDVELPLERNLEVPT